MKRHATLLILLTLFSCTKESEKLPSKLVELKVSVVSESKSTFHAGDQAIKWTRGDRIAVYDGEAVREFTTEESSGKAVFSGKVSSRADELSVIYPYSPDADYNNASALIPDIQWAVPDGFADDANVAVGKCSAGSPEVTLSNVGGYVRITVPAGGYHALTGIDFIAGGKTTSLLAPGKKLQPANYYICAAPGNISSFTVVLHDTDGLKASFGSEKPNRITRNAVLDLGSIPSDLNWTSEAQAGTYSLSVDFSDGAWPFDTAPGTTKYPDTGNTFIPGGTGGYAFNVSGKSYYADDFIIGPNSSLSLPVVPGHRLVGATVVSSSEYAVPFFTGDGGRRASIVAQASSADYFCRISGLPEERITLRDYSSCGIKSLTLTYGQTSAERRIVKSVAADGSFTFEGGSEGDYITGTEGSRPFVRPKGSSEACNFYGPENQDGKKLITIDFKSTCSLEGFPTARQDAAVPEKEYTISGTPYKISLGCSGTSARYLYRNKNHLHCNYLRAKFPVIDGYYLEKVTFVQTIRNCAGAYLFGEEGAYKGLASSNYTAGTIGNQYCFLPSGVPSGTAIWCMSDHILQIDSINLEYRKIK